MVRLESSIAEGNITEEAMKFATEYCRGMDPKWGSLGLLQDEEIVPPENLPSAYTKRVMFDMVYEQAHKFVLINHPAMEWWMDKYDEERRLSP
jgi:hypothetical protein